MHIPYNSCKINPLTTDDECTYHATLAACYQLAQSVLKIVFALAKKSGIRGGGQISAWGAVHMVAALAGCRKALVGTGLGTSRLFDTSRCQRALNLVSSLMSWGGRGHEP